MEDSKIIYTETIEITKSNSVTIQFSNFKGKDYLNIYKSSFSDRYTGIVKNNSIAFSYENSINLHEIIKEIPENYELKEYGKVGKYVVYISNFNGNNSFQIREWVESDKYNGYGKKGVSIPIDKFGEFKINYEKVLNEFHNYIANGTSISNIKTVDDNDIESYF